jgi:hypothetical protein
MPKKHYLTREQFQVLVWVAQGYECVYTIHPGTRQWAWLLDIPEKDPWWCTSVVKALFRHRLVDYAEYDDAVLDSIQITDEAEAAMLNYVRRLRKYRSFTLKAVEESP